MLKNLEVTICDFKLGLNDVGWVVEEWMKSTDIRNEIELGAFVVMPNHLHGIGTDTGLRAKTKIHRIIHCRFQTYRDQTY